MDGVFDKHVIIIDGFDPQDERKIYDTKKNIYYCGLTLFDNENRNLGDEFRKQGYDLVVLNFPIYYLNGMKRDGGTDYIERNSMILFELIQKLNRMKRGKENSSIIEFQHVVNDSALFLGLHG